jgi:putative membrane protein
MRQLMLVCLLAVSTALAAESSSPDQAFYAKVAVAGLAEVEAGKLAQRKGASRGVREFGSMMVADHSLANTKLKSLAARKNVKLPAEPDAEHQKAQSELETANGAAFDAAYIKNQIAAHEAAEALLKKEIESGKDADAKAFAQELLPTVSEHLKTARELASPGPRSQ